MKLRILTLTEIKRLLLNKSLFKGFTVFMYNVHTWHVSVWVCMEQHIHCNKKKKNKALFHQFLVGIGSYALN